MHPPSLETAVRRIRSLTVPPDPQSDRDLLARFRATRDDAAFAALVARHGPAVLGVCRRILHDPHAADDAFQATFLVLARRARSIRNAASLGCWLHGVAVRVAMKHRGRLARQPRTVESVELPASPRDDVLWRDVRRVLDEEVNRLPERLRLPVFLCYFEGKTRDEAAEALGWKLTTLRGRLEDGRLRLRTRLALRGVELSAAMLALSAAEGLAVTDPLLETTVRTVGGVASPTVQALAKGVAMSGTIARAKLTVGTLLLVVGLGTTLLVYRGEAGEVPLPGSRPKAREPAKEKEPPPAPKPPKEDAWGDPAEGVKSRLRIKKTKLQPREPLAFELDLMNEGSKTWKPLPIPFDCQVIVGNVRYAYLGPIDYKVSAKELKPGGELVPFVTVTADKTWTTRTQIEGEPGGPDKPSAPLNLPPGKHQIRVAFPVSNTVRPVSNTVEIEVEPPPLDPLVGAMALAADRIWVVSSPTREKPVPTALEALKGPLAGNPSVFDLRLLSGADPAKKWLVFLKAEEEGKPNPEVKLMEPQWSLPFDEATAEGIRQAIRPTEWGTERYGLQMGLRLRQTFVPANGPVMVDVTIRNASAETRPLFQHRFNIYDYWPITQFEVTAPSGRWVLMKPEGAIKELDVPARITLKPGETYTQAMRLDRWVAHPIPPKEGVYSPNVFTAPGEYSITAHYVAFKPTVGVDSRLVPPLASNTVKLTLAKDEPWGEAVGGVQARVRLAKPKFRAGEPLAFEFDLKITGDKAYDDWPIPVHCRVELDGNEFRFISSLNLYTPPFGYSTAMQKLEPGKEYSPYVKVEAHERWTHVRGPQSVPLILTPGKHTLRVSYPLPVPLAGLLPVSQKVEFDVVHEDAMPPDLPKLADLADRIVVADITFVSGVPTFNTLRILKGPNFTWPTTAPPIAVPTGADILPGERPDDPIPGEVRKEGTWILFLKAEEDSVEIPKLSPAAARGWYRKATEKEIAAVVAALPKPKSSGANVNGVWMSLQPVHRSVRVGEPIRFEVVLANDQKDRLRILQQRYNTYDYWPFLTFTVTRPNGHTIVLSKPDGVFKREDFIDEMSLKAGEFFSHTVRLDRWPSFGHPVDFDVPGTHKVEATYKAPVGFKNLRPGVVVYDWPFWVGEVKSNVVTIEVKPAEKSPFDDVRLVAKPGQVPLLYVVLTDTTAGPPLLAELVIQHAGAALAEADRRKFSTGNVVFLIRRVPGDTRGTTTGFSREQLEEIRKAKPDEARRLIGRHAWTMGTLPKE